MRNLWVPPSSLCLHQLMIIFQTTRHWFLLAFVSYPLIWKQLSIANDRTFSIYFFPLFRQLLGFLVAIILSRLSFAIIQNGSLICYNLIRIKCKIVHLPLHILFWMIVYSAQIIICLDFCLFLFSAWHIFPILLFKDSHFCHWAWGILIFFQKKKKFPLF